jgi:putative hydrolase of HD superfamily
LTEPSRSSLGAATRYLFEVGQLKLSKRTGWWQAGVPEPESIAEHTFRTAIIGYCLAVLEQADPDLTAVLCLFHDVAEARIGDIPNVAKSYVSHRPELEIAADQVAGMPDALRESILGVVGLFEAQDSPEALLAKDADRLECVMQAREYEHQGYRNTGPWMRSNLAKLRSSAARRLGEQAMSMPPDEWWKTFRSETLAAELPGSGQ